MPTPIPGKGNRLAISKRRESIEAAAARLRDKRDCEKNMENVSFCFALITENSCVIC